MKPSPLQFLALHPPARGSRRLRENIPPNMIRRFLDGEARAWKHSTLAGALWETGVRASRAIATAEKFFSAPQNKSCADSPRATNSPCRQYGGTVPAEPGKPIETEKMKHDLIELADATWNNWRENTTLLEVPPIAGDSYTLTIFSFDGTSERIAIIHGSGEWEKIEHFAEGFKSRARGVYWQNFCHNIDHSGLAVTPHASATGSLRWRPDLNRGFVKA